MTPFLRIVACAGCAFACSVGCRTTPHAEPQPVPVQPAPVTSSPALQSGASDEALGLSDVEGPSIQLTALDGEDSDRQSNPTIAAPRPAETLSLPWLIEQVEYVNPSVQA